MSSPYRKAASPLGSPASRWRQSTPQRSINGQRSSPFQRESTTSPSRLLAEELSRVYISDSKAFKHSLDLQDDEQEKLHRQALIKSLAEHEAVRESAERARQRVELEMDRARRKLEEEERLRLEEERLKGEREERDRKAKEAARLEHLQSQQKAKELEESQRRENEKRKKEQVEEQRRQQQQKQKQQEEEKIAKEASVKQQREKEEEERKQAEKSAAASTPAPLINKTSTISSLLNAPAPAPSTTSSTPSAEGWKSVKALPALLPQGIVSTADQREAEHQRYMAMHQKLKEMRKWVLGEARKTPGMTNQLSEMRRSIKKLLGMFNAVDSSLNTKPTSEIKALLDQAAKSTQISISPTPFIVALDQDTEGAAGDAQYPAALLFLLNYFAKYILQRFTDHVARDPKSAEPYGILTMRIFVEKTYHFRGHSLIDILWAKYHKTCPVLFGICGNEKTVSGKHRLGWKFEKDYESNKPGAGTFIGTEEHLGNQAGLATGFAAITLRDFGGPREQNPAPNQLYWTSMARVLSTPPQDRTSTHLVVARNMIELYVPRFIRFFGGAAIAALQKLFKDWPSAAEDKKDPNVLALEGLPRFFERDHHLYL